MNETVRIFLQDHEPIDFLFEQNRDDFIVDEIFAKPFKTKGNFLILHVKKVNMTTWEMIERIASFLNIPASSIGYAGLKDKYATTTQYLSLPLKYERSLNKLQDKQITILETFKDSKKISIGDLKSNRFTVTLRNVDDIKAGKIEKVARNIEKIGFPNYFGYQRFGQDSETQAQQMIEGEIFIQDKKLKKFLTSVYQSKKFNEWLKERVEISKADAINGFKLLKGDVMMSDDDKLFTPKSPSLTDFRDKKIVLTGLLVGREVFRARDEAREIEKKYDDELLQEKGLRRRAWVYPQDLTCKYRKKDSAMELSFVLPKASYATVFIENIANKNFN
ncbi:tRNA pseudouridine(13) synthase TruD [Sulfurimonas sp. HSL-1716]|uniref:tRNA pseudouridine(13) synthase TruD n=1 Tax=Hydrocurvibacter sulfurireducens TaxID=3131937 RepID=UPI0031F9F485